MVEGHDQLITRLKAAWRCLNYTHLPHTRLPQTRLLLPALGAAVLVSACNEVAPVWRHPQLLLMLPLFAMLPATFFLPLAVAHYLLVIVALVYIADGVAGFMLASAACALLLLLGQLAMGSRPDPARLFSGLDTPPAHRFLHRWYAWGVLICSALLLYRGIPVPLTGLWLLFAVAVKATLPPLPPVAWRQRAAAAVGAGLFLLGITVMTLALLEVGSRVLVTQLNPYTHLFTMHSKYYRLLRPNGATKYHIPLAGGGFKEVTAKISEQGLRDRSFGPKAPDEVRILMLGDSFVFGWATDLEDTIPKQLEVLLGEQLGGRLVTVVNAGVGATGPWQHRGLLHEVGFGLEPDIVLHGLHPNNDIGDTLVRVGQTLHAHHPWEHGRRVVFKNRHRLAVRLHIGLDRHSHLYNALTSHMLNEAAAIVANNRIRFVPPVDFHTGYRKERRDPNLEANLKQWYLLLDEGFELMGQDIAAIAADCAERGIPYIAFSIPGTIDFPEAYSWDAEIEADYERAKALLLTQAFLQDAGIDFIEIYSALLAHPEPDSLYYMHDGHLSEEGSRIVAALLAEALLWEYPGLLRDSPGAANALR